MISKHVVFIFAGLALAGCCASGTTCDVPTAGAHAAWDGLGPDLIPGLRIRMGVHGQHVRDQISSFPVLSPKRS